MSGVSSLLKYRYQKKTNSDKSSNSSPITISSSNSSTQDIGNSQSSSSEPTSPVFPSKFAKSKEQSSKSAVTTVSKTSTAKASSGNSQWMSKDQLKANSKKKTRLVDSDNDNSSDSCDSFQLDPRELQMKVRSMSEMFPDFSPSRLEETLNQTRGSIDAAIDIVIKLKAADDIALNQRKRKYAIFQPSSMLTSPESSPFAPQTKRSRKLSSSDESTDTKPQSNNDNVKPVPVISSQPVTNGCSASTSTNTNSAEPERPDACVIYERIKFLQEAFPNISRQELKRVLTVSQYDIELATATLTSYQTGEPISQTKNVGSIKAFMASREQAKVVATTSTNSNVVSLDGAVDSNPVKKMDRRNIIIADSDSDEDVKLEDDKDFAPSKSTNELVLDFFNVATLEELTIMNGCSRKKAEIVVTMRPFADWDDLVAKLNNCQSLPSYLLGEGREVIRLRSTVMELMERCQNISSELQDFIADLTSRTSIDASDTEHSYLSVQPACLSKNMQLKPYQMVGLNWLMMMHAHDLNGILGDEMGLGKTIQTIAFLAQLYTEGIKGPHIIVAPSSTIDNWLRELQLWCPSLNVLLYYGSQETRRTIRNDIIDGEMDEFHILLTTYNMATGSVEDRVLFKKFKFYYAIFDEGHMLKNMDSIRFKSLTKILAKRRLILTGTPLQNNLIELMSLLVFLMPNLFVGKTDILKRIFSTFTSRGPTDSRGTYERETLIHTKQILKPFFLRRLKTEVLQQLPAKVTSVLYVPMSFEQQDLYDELIRNFARDIDNESPSTAAEPEIKVEGEVVGKIAQRQQSRSSMMMQLRKAANHHLLHRRQFDDSRLRQMAQLMLEEPTHREANVQFVFEDMQVMSDFELHRLCNHYQVLKPFRLDEEMIVDSGKFRHLDEVLPPMKTKGDRVLFFSQFTMMLDIVEEYMKSRQHKYIRLDGNTPVAERQELIDKYNTDQSLFIFLLSTKAGGLGINLTAANVVILHDIDFNPYNDKQAEDRCHRVGQTRDVTIYRLISKNTIEEAMLRGTEAKLKLEMDVTGIGSNDAEDIDSNDVASLLKEALQMRSSAS